MLELAVALAFFQAPLSSANLTEAATGLTCSPEIVEVLAIPGQPAEVMAPQPDYLRNCKSAPGAELSIQSASVVVNLDSGESRTLSFTVKDNLGNQTTGTVTLKRE